MIDRFWILALRNLKRNIGRNLATGSAIAFGFIGIHMLGAYSNRVVNYLRVHTVYLLQSGHLQIYAHQGLQKFPYQPKKFSIPLSSQQKIREILSAQPFVVKVERQLMGAGLLGNGCLSYPFIAKGYEPAVSKWTIEHPQVKSWMPEMKVFKKGNGLWNYSEELGAISLSTGLAKLLSKEKVYEEFANHESVPVDCIKARNSRESFDSNVQMVTGAWTGSMGAVDGEVVSLFSTGFAESDNSVLQLSTTRLQMLLDTDNISNFAVWVNDESEIVATRNSLQKNFQEQGLDLEIYQWNEEAISPYFYGTVNFIYSLFSFLGIILCAIISLSVLNSATMTVLERSQELGMYRAYGFRRSHISKLFLIECLWLSLISIGVGLVVGTVLIFSVNNAHIKYSPPGMSEGITLKLIPDFLFSFSAAFLILGLVLLTTYFSVKNQLKSNVADLLGSLNR